MSNPDKQLSPVTVFWSGLYAIGAVCVLEFILNLFGYHIPRVGAVALMGVLWGYSLYSAWKNPKYRNPGNNDMFPGR